MEMKFSKIGCLLSWQRNSLVLHVLLVAIFLGWLPTCSTLYSAGEDTSAHQADPIEKLLSQGETAFDHSDYATAQSYYEQALKRAQELGQRSSEALAVLGLGKVSRYMRQYEEARAYSEQALKIARELGERSTPADGPGRHAPEDGARVGRSPAVRP